MQNWYHFFKYLEELNGNAIWTWSFVMDFKLWGSFLNRYSSIQIFYFSFSLALINCIFQGICWLCLLIYMICSIWQISNCRYFQLYHFHFKSIFQFSDEIISFIRLSLLFLNSVNNSNFWLIARLDSRSVLFSRISTSCMWLLANLSWDVV